MGGEEADMKPSYLNLCTEFYDLTKPEAGPKEIAFYGECLKEAFKRAGLPIPYRMATAEEIAAEAWKFSNTNGGISIQIRGNK